MSEEFNNVEEQVQEEAVQTENNDYSNPYATAEPQTVALEQVEGNLIAGIVGAILGSLIGCILWVIIYNLGYIAGIAGLAIGVCAFKGYELLGKRLDVKATIITLIIMILMIFFANRLAWGIDAYNALKDYDWTFSEVFQNLDYIIEESDLTMYYYKDLIVGYLLTALSSYKFVINAFKAAKANN